MWAPPGLPCKGDAGQGTYVEAHWRRRKGEWGDLLLSTRGLCPRPISVGPPLRSDDGKRLPASKHHWRNKEQKFIPMMGRDREEGFHHASAAYNARRRPTISTTGKN